ncbi:type I polyketide synthase [Kitasatospora viridis]|uniref:Phthiocerol/phenolphthiocerol synthesis type-I polyketide synthase C n=1 Tax=Kitasatospora viridis TaxID=281105 RepID=A0A561UJX8_9ACTN|nr:type I polyketide synthase [Kitasatospora viridis]TWF99635.1 phthiocerol/phenolphthiocerol synthesis type-I polyketide synthase C [Kitasatospora viridis]
MHADEPTNDPGQLVAVVGMAGRFPGAPDIESFWQLLMERGDAIGPVPADRWDASAQLDPEKSVQAVGGFLTGVDLFDPTFFGISPREADDIDPQHRLVLEAAWRALEDAGRPAAGLRGSRTGVYVGASWHDYEILRKDRGAGASQHSAVGNALDVAAARVSYFLGLTGPSLTVETGCSSALVALHLAAQALRAGEVEGALVGGVNLILAPDVSIGLTHFGGLSPTGRCHAFSADADGFVRGEGVVALYLKTLDRALADGDRVHGVIARTVVNNDGGGESLVTPNPDGQRALLEAAYGDGAIPLDRLAYVEAHGTGTRRGDPVEAGGIGEVLGRRRDRALGPLGIGSAKTNIGHLEAAAGIAGLVKGLLSLEHGVVPPSLHAERLNPDIPFEELGVEVVREPLALPSDGRPVYLGVNSFGWGGTNAHVVLMSAPPAPAAEPAGEVAGPVLLPLSARTEEVLRQRAGELAEVLGGECAPEPRALAGTLARRRDHFPARAAFSGATAAELADQLRQFAADPEAEVEGAVTGRARERGLTAFVFPGQGSQWAGMGRELHRSSPVFAAVVRRCARALAPHVDWDLSAIVAGEAGEEWLTRIDMLQPVLWAVSLGLAELWREAGIEPDVVIGHSQGEVTAATLAGILSYEDGALVMARRSAIARRTSGQGRMLAVDLDVAGAERALEGFEELVSLAVNNGPSSCVLSGDEDAVLTLKEILEADGVFCRLVNVDYASHSPQMDPLREDLLAALAPVRPRAGEVPLMSTVRLSRLDGPEMDTAYWVENLRRPVLFADAMSALFDQGVTHVVEISPHTVLVPAIEQLAALRPEPPAVLGTLRRDAGAPADLARAFAHGYVRGLEPFATLPADALVPAPGYPWQRASHWPEPGRRRAATAPSGLEVALLPAAGEPDAWQGALELGPDEHPWLTDHRVHDAVVLPAAAMLALALSTARARTGALPGTLTGLAFTSDLTLGQEPARLAVHWRDDVTEGGSFTLRSLPTGATAWTEHAAGRVRQHRDPVEPAGFPQQLAALEAGDPADFYTACTARGLNYGPAFQGVRELRQADGAALGLVRLPERCRAGLRPHSLHPALWDAALQVSLALFAGERAVVPVAVERIRLFGELAEPVDALWSHAVRRDATRVDLHLFDTEHRPLLTMEGLTLHELALAEQADGEGELVHRLRLRPAARPEPAGPAGRWAVCGGGATAQLLATALGATVIELAPDAAELTGTPDGVAFVAPDAEAGLDAQRRALLDLTALVRAALALATPPRLAVVTTGAQAVTPADRADPGAALFWGFTRVLRREHPELQPLIVDLAPGQLFDFDWAADAAAELLAGDGEDQVVLRDGLRLVGRLVRGEESFEESFDGAGQDQQPVPWRTPAQPFRLSPDRPGFWDGLRYRPLARRTPQQGEIEIAVTAAAANFIDVMKAMGTYPDPSGGADLLGGECAGTVTAVGPDVTGLRVGDRVVACAFGSMASHVTVRADHAQPVPGHLDDEAAAALPLVLTTAWYGLVELARLAPGETVLVHSAAGGLGLAAVRIARALGARVIATAGSEEKRAHLRALGVEQVYDSRDLSWADQVRAATDGHGVDVVLNSLTGAAIPLGLEALAEDGRFIEVGKKDIYGGRPISLAAFRKGITLASVDLAGLMARRPERFARLFREAWTEVVEGRIEPLPVLTYPFAAAAEALREMSRGSHIGKFVLSDPASVTGIAPQPLAGGRLRADGSYLVTGGLGALGLSLAGFLADRGAGAVALLGRSEPSAEAAERIAELRARGVQVVTARVDVTDRQALTEALDKLRAGLPPLRGVFHAAGLLDDATVLNLTPGQLERVLAPKVDGARHLDAATAEDPLDLFVLFSSAAALFGNAGQAAYAAGNAYLDALAQDRRRRGRPGLSVQWGPFEQIGLAAQDANRGARLAERGMGGFTAEQAWAALARFLEREEQVVGYVPLNLRQWFDAYPDTAAQRSWQLLREASREGGGAVAGSEFLAGLAGAPQAEWPPLVEAKVRELAGRVLRLDAAAIDRETPFKALGLDSLMGLELRNRLEAAFGLKLSPTLLWSFGTAAALSGVLCERLGEAAAAADAVAPNAG